MSDLQYSNSFLLHDIFAHETNGFVFFNDNMPSVEDRISQSTSHDSCLSPILFTFFEAPFSL